MKKILSVFVLIIVILNLIFFALGVITALIFWFVLAVCGVFAYVLIPRLRH